MLLFGFFGGTCTFNTYARPRRDVTKSAPNVHDSTVAVPFDLALDWEIAEVVGQPIDSNSSECVNEPWNTRQLATFKLLLS